MKCGVLAVAGILDGPRSDGAGPTWYRSLAAGLKRRSGAGRLAACRRSFWFLPACAVPPTVAARCDSDEITRTSRAAPRA